MSKELINIWEGIYKDFHEAPIDDGVFDSGPWLDKQANRIAEILKDGSVISTTTAYPLTPVLATMVNGDAPVRVLDFGGSVGTEYLAARDSIAVNGSIDFTIVENAAICERGKALFANESAIHFVSEMPDSQNVFDVVHAGSSIQYVDDWRSLLKTFCAFKPGYIILSEVLAGENPSFVTVQNYYGRNIVVRFLNMDELVRYMGSLGYVLTLRQNYTSKSNGNGEPLPMENFPQEYRVNYTSNLVFKRL